jgi:hypothetical protein
VFAIKAAVSDPGAEVLTFNAQKTMYGGKHNAKGDIFASGNQGAWGPIASGRESILVCVRARAQRASTSKTGRCGLRLLSIRLTTASRLSVARRFD